MLGLSRANADLLWAIGGSQRSFCSAEPSSASTMKPAVHAVEGAYTPIIHG